MADYDIGAAFGEIEDELISSMIRNLKRHQVEEIAEGMEWSQWQALQLQALEDYKRKAAQKYGSKFSTINDKVDKMLTDTYNTAETSQEQKILKAIQKGIPETVTPLTGSGEIQGEFFKTNDRKLDTLIKATTSDMEKAEHAVLRMTDDKYRKIIFNAQVYANTGAGTYQKAVDMATKDFLSAGINCIEYKNGRRVPIDVYAEMAIRTANKRAYLQGEGEMRKKWGIHTVIMNKRTNPCPKCAPFVGKVIVDDVWSGGTAEEAEEKGYLLMSDCIKRGLYHPNCQDSHTTYFGDILDEEDEENTEEQEQTEGEPETNDKGISETDTSKNAESSTEDGVRQMPLTEESKNFARENGYDSTVPTSENQITPREQRINEQLYDAEQRQNYCERQVQRFERMSKYSLDKDNQRIYKARKSEWKEKKKEVDLQINEIKREINKAQNKVIRPRIKSLALASSDPVRLTNYSLNISPDIEKKNENNSPQEVANSAGSGIISVTSNAHPRNTELENIIQKCIKQDEPVFANDLARNFAKIKPEKGKYIIALHGTPYSTYLYEHKIDEKILANIIRSRKDYNNEAIVLISCNTGNTENTKTCFAQKLANELGVAVYAPTRFGAILSNGKYYSSDVTGLVKEGIFKKFIPKKKE